MVNKQTCPSDPLTLAASYFDISCIRVPLFITVSGSHTMCDPLRCFTFFGEIYYSP